MRKLAIAFLLLLCGGNAVFAENEIPLQVQNESSSSKNRPRSITPEVTASIDGIAIILDLSVLADCEYSVKDCTTQCPADGKLVSCFVNIHDLMMPNNEQLEIKSYVSTKIDGLFYVSDEATLGVNTPLIYRE